MQGLVGSKPLVDLFSDGIIEIAGGGIPKKSVNGREGVGRVGRVKLFTCGLPAQFGHYSFVKFTVTKIYVVFLIFFCLC